MSTQRQRRRGTTAQHASFTGALGEVTLDTDRDALVVHDALRAGGFPIPNAREAQNRHFTFVAAGGTADALTLTLLEVPAAYAEGQLFAFKAASNNTTAATVNVNALGVKSIKKLDAAQAKIALAADDLVSGRIYEITYDGTDFVAGGGGLGGGGAMVLLGSQTIGSPVASVDFNALFEDSTYNGYLLVGNRVTPAAGTNVQLGLRFREGGSYKSGASDYGYAVRMNNLSGTLSTDNSTSADAIYITDNVLGSSSEVYFAVHIFPGDATAVVRTHVLGQSVESVGGRAGRVSGDRNASAVTDGVQIIVPGQNMDVGTFSLYGLRST